MCKQKESNEVMQLDGTMGCATALLEMLAHTHSGVTKLFAGIPDKWKNASFMNIRLSGAFLLSASKEDGKFKEAEVKSLKGGKIKIDIFGVKSTMLCQHGEHKQIQLPCSITLSKGEQVRLSLSEK
jgi:glycosyl hydrolase family 95